MSKVVYQQKVNASTTNCDKTAPIHEPLHAYLPFLNGLHVKVSP